MSNDWRLAGEGKKWLPVLAMAEASLGLPPDLLARVAYQESRFRPEIIDGTHPSPAGALGIMQLMPQFWYTVRVKVPFTEENVRSQIYQAAHFLLRLHVRFGSWPEALAAYNFGPGNEDKYLEHKIAGLPKETRDYVEQILADLPFPWKEVSV